MTANRTLEADPDTEADLHLQDSSPELARFSTADFALGSLLELQLQSRRYLTPEHVRDIAVVAACAIVERRPSVEDVANVQRDHLSIEEPALEGIGDIRVKG